MRIYYIDEADGPTCYVRSALGVDTERWNSLHSSVQSWRYAMAGDYNVPTSRKLDACDLLARRGNLVRIDNTGRRLTPEQGAEIFMNGLRIIEGAAFRRGGIEVINVCLRKATSGTTAGPAWTGCSTASTPPSRRTGATPTSSRRGGRVDGRAAPRQAQGAQPRSQPVRGLGGRRGDEGHPHRADHRRPVLPKLPGRRPAPNGDLIAHALLKQEESPSSSVTELGLHLAFGILDRTLNRKASRRDPRASSGGEERQA